MASRVIDLKWFVMYERMEGAMKWGENDCSARCTFWVAFALLALVCLFIFSSMYDDTQARVADQGNYALRSGPHPSGLAMWSDDGARWEDE